MTPEGKVKAKVKRALATLPKAFKFMPVQNGMGAPALDWLTCIKSTFIAIETKKPGGKMTPRQEATAKAIADAGGVVFVIRNQDDINFMMGMLRGERCMCFGCVYDGAPLYGTSGS